MIHIRQNVTQLEFSVGEYVQKEHSIEAQDDNVFSK